MQVKRKKKLRYITDVYINGMRKTDAYLKHIDVHAEEPSKKAAALEKRNDVARMIKDVNDSIEVETERLKRKAMLNLETAMDQNLDLLTREDVSDKDKLSAIKITYDFSKSPNKTADGSDLNRSKHIIQ